MGARNDAPGGTRGLAADRILHHSEGFLWPIHKINADFNQQMSTIAEGMARNLNPGEDITIAGDDQNPEIPPEEHSGPGARRIHRDNIIIRAQDTVQSQIGEAARIYFEKSEAEYERLFPNVQFGQSNPGDAGYLQVIKTNAATAVTQESLRGASAAGKRTFDEFVSQMRSQKMTFRVAAWRQNGKTGQQDFEGGDFTSAMWPDQFILNYEILFDLPPNEAAKAEVARAMKEGGWMSDREIMVNIFDNPDPDKTLALIEQQRQYNSPSAQASRDRYAKRQEALDLFAAAEDEPDKELRKMLLREAYIFQAEYEAMVAAMAPQARGTPAGPPGFSSSTMPPEEGVGTNPDRNAQARGAVSSYTGGKPRTVGGA